MTPVDGIAQRLLPFRQVERAPRKQLQWALQPIQNGAGRQNFGSGGCQLNRQGQSIQTRADFLDSRCIV